MRERVTIGPFGIFFTNKNTTHKLKGHSHYAQVRLTYQSRAGVGFPSFKDTHDVMADKLRELTARPFADHTNEALARVLFEELASFRHPIIDAWGGDYFLAALELGVQGVHDAIGHAAGMTLYTVEVDA